MFNTIKLTFLSIKQRQWALGFMLLTLHAILLWGFNSPLQKALLICHYGFFLLWQPVWQAQERLSITASVLFLLAGGLIIFLVDWWFIAFWISGLFGLLGGRVFSAQAKSTRLGYLLAAGYLLAVLLIWVVPKLLNSSADIATTEIIVKYFIPLIPLAILFTRVEAGEGELAPVLDFFYTLLLMLLAIILVLASFAIQASSKADYAEVLLIVLFGLAITLVGISWLWNPRAGFSGIGQLLSGYLLSVGLPFEQWVKNIAELAERESSPKEFTLAAMREVTTLPWISGVNWYNSDSHVELGVATKYRASLDSHGFKLILYTRWPLTPALTIHMKLLTQILGEFHEAKRREETLRQNTYMQAVYETGSRLTHDIKNLVQSMSVLCSAAELTSDTDSEQLLALVRRQLPLLNQRLALTLDKLQAPNNKTSNHMPLANWWSALKQRHGQSHIEFLAGKIPGIEVDAEVLDSVVDNLLQNAIEKSKNQPGLTIQAEIGMTHELSLEVTDNGEAISQLIAEQLFKKQISSENGLGIGLYHASRQASQAGYLLSLAENRDGVVRFRLSQEPNPHGIK